MPASPPLSKDEFSVTDAVKYIFCLLLCVDGKHSTPSSSTRYSAKIEQEIDNQSVMKRRWRQFKTGGDQKVKKILTILLKAGSSLDQKGTVEALLGSDVFCTVNYGVHTFGWLSEMANYYVSNFFHKSLQFFP